MISAMKTEECTDTGRERRFRFKEFSVSHRISAMKVGVDGVLLGAWADVSGNTVLDIGCGCGLIAIMAAQRNSSARVTGIDIDPGAAMEAAGNARTSPWSDRITIACRSLRQQIELGTRFDNIVSNPPFFNSGIATPATNREISRHCAGLCPETILLSAEYLMNPDGSISLITPAEALPSLLAAAGDALRCHRLTEVVTVEGKEPKRILSVWLKRKGRHADTLRDRLVIETGPHGRRTFSKEYIHLCSPFYIHM